jgi:rubrerythrin
MSSKENLIKIFEYALNQEKTGMSFFRTSLDRMGFGAAIDAFRKLIEEEQHHIDFITRILKSLKEKDEVEIPEMKHVSIEETDFFDDRAESEFLEQCIEGSMVPDVTVFNTAWLIEKDLSEFYEKMASQTEGKAKQALEMLSRWEKGHEIFFRKYRDKLSDMYAKMPWGG